MVQYCPNEGEHVVANLLFSQAAPDRGAGLELGLYTNPVIFEEITMAEITEPSGAGYARIALTDGSWTVVDNKATYPLQSFVAGAGGWSGAIYGWFVATTGTTPRLLGIGDDANLLPDGWSLTGGDIYRVNLECRSR